MQDRPLCDRRASGRRIAGLICALLVLLRGAETPTHAQDAGPAKSETPSHKDSGDEAQADGGVRSDRIFGVLPNYATVEGVTTTVRPITTRQTFRLAVLNSFDPYVFPFIGVVAGLGQGAGSAYGTKYATALTDNAVGNFMTSAVFPSVLRQDPRYFELGTGGRLRRAGYALTRSVVTRSRSGHAQFNYSEIGGNAIAAGISNAYYPQADRTVSGTLTRWGMQVMWDTLSNELKEFWPDIRQRIRKH